MRSTLRPPLAPGARRQPLRLLLLCRAGVGLVEPMGAGRHDQRVRIVELELPIPYDPAAPFLREATPEALRAMSWLYPHFVTADGVLRLSVHALLVDATVQFRVEHIECMG